MNNLLKRYLPATLLARNNPAQLTFSPALNDTIQKILREHLPNNVRRHVQMNYQGTARYPPATELTVDSFIAANFLTDFGSFSDIFRNLNGRYYLKPSKILEITDGPAPGLCAFFDSCMKDSTNDLPPLALPPQDSDVKIDQIDVFIDSPNSIMHNRATQLLQNVTKCQVNLLNNLPVVNEDTGYDFIILSKLEYDMKLVLSFLNMNGIVIVKQPGTPEGFEKIAEFRSRLLKTDKLNPNIEIKSVNDNKFQPFKIPKLFNGEYYKILEPCPHHNACPLQLGNPEFYKNSKKYMICANRKSIERPPYVLNLKRGKLLAKDWNNTNVKENKILRGKGRPFGRNWEQISYSYLIIQKVNYNTNQATTCTNSDAVHDTSIDKTPSDSKLPIGLRNENYKDTWPRIISTPNKQKGHIIMDICTPQGNLEKWITPRSLSNSIYHDARKSNCGDQWSHEPKTKILSRGNIDKKKLKSELKTKLKKEKIEEKAQLHKNWNKLKGIDENEVNDFDEVSKVYGEVYESLSKKQKKFN